MSPPRCTPTSSETTSIAGRGASWSGTAFRSPRADHPKLRRLLEFAGIARDVADPWYTGNFDETYADVVAGCAALLRLL